MVVSSTYTGRVDGPELPAQTSTHPPRQGAKMDIPADAQRSEDGHYWWDETNQQWQAVDQSQSMPASSSSAAGSSGSSDPNERLAVVDPSDYPTAAMYVHFDSIDDPAAPHRHRPQPAADRRGHPRRVMSRRNRHDGLFGVTTWHSPVLACAAWVAGWASSRPP